MSVRRSLVSIRRLVPGGDSAEYDLLWNQLEGAVSALGSHAWRFSAASNPARRMEFLEFSSGPDPRASESVAALLDRLDRVAPGEVEEWVA
jgi:hypothetical protein